MTLLVQISWALLALIHAAPALALFRPALLAKLYGAEAGGTPYLLLHHRAALFLGIVILCIWAMLDSHVRPVAAVVTVVSMLGFLMLYWHAGSPPALKSIAIADLVGLIPLAVVTLVLFRP